LLRSSLWGLGLRYRLHWRTPTGRPDIVITARKLAVFVDGCFWHGCPVHYSRPSTQADYWAEKLRRNVERDRRQTLALEALGWTVLRTWEHEVHDDALAVATRISEVASGVVQPAATPEWRIVCVTPLSLKPGFERCLQQDLRDPTCRRTIDVLRKSIRVTT